MATTKKQGKGYLITVTNGIDMSGKKIRAYHTWAPPPGLTERQEAKLLGVEAMKFEEAVKNNERLDGNIRLADFTERFFAEHGNKGLKNKSSYEYGEKLRVINMALGHIKLQDLRRGHIVKFINNLQEEGIRRRVTAVRTDGMEKWLHDTHLIVSDVCRGTGLSRGTVKQAISGGRISEKSATLIAKYMGAPLQKAFSLQRDNTPLSAGTIRTYHRVLSAVLSKAVKWQCIAENPAHGVDLPSIAGQKAAYLDDVDALRLLELLREEHIRWRTFFIFDLLSGLRRGELAGLCWDCVDFDHDTIQVSKTSNYTPKDGVYVDTPKSAESIRYIRVSPSAMIVLAAYKQLWYDPQREALGDAWKDIDDRVFVNDFGAPLFPDSITKWFGKFIERTRLPKITVHSLRHTYASLLINDGIPLVVVAGNLGHAQVSTTNNYYSHVIKSATARAAQVFSKYDSVILPQEDADITNAQAVGE